MPTRQIVDTHAHICDPVFDEDRSDVLERAGDDNYRPTDQASVGKPNR